MDQGRKIGNRSTESEADRASKVIRLRRCQTISQKKVVTAGMVQDKSRSGRFEEYAGKSGNDFQFTPLGCKIGSLEFGIDKILGSSNCDKNDDCGSGNTPPAEATVSPEIQCGSMTVMSVATPICFGAGHVLSGVSDKRKCRPRGVLVVGGDCNGIDGLNSSNEDLDGIRGVDLETSFGLVPPLPAEASVHWLLSPCEEDDIEQNGISELITSVRLHSSLSGSSDSLSHSPTCITPNDGVVSWFDEKIYSNMAGQNSHDSKDTLGSENVIQTPESYSSLERHMSLPWLYADDDKHGVKPNLDCAVDDKHRLRVSSEDQILVSEQIDSSFEFDCHLKPTSSTEFSQLQYNWDNSSWISDEIVENEQQSQFRISWKDGLSCHHIEMENSDFTRILPDEEDKNDQCSFNPASIKPKLLKINTSSFIKKTDVKSTGCMNRVENSSIQKDIQCAESINLNGGSSLAGSGDSGWNLCYKDCLFPEE